MYDYRCERCSASFEIRQSFSDDSLTVCPVEGGPAACEAPGRGAVKKVFSGVAISFKGDGFYKNDHGANAAGRKKEREASSSKDSAKESSSDSGSSSSASDSGNGSSRAKAEKAASSA